MSRKGKSWRLRLNWGNDQSERTQATATQARWPGHTGQPHHRLLSGIRRAVGGAGPADSPTGEYPSSGRRPAPSARPDLRQRHILRAAYRLPVEGVGRHGHLLNGSTAHLRFQEWVAAGIFRELWRTGLERYDELQGLDWSWLSMDGALTKAPLGGGKNRAQSHRPG